VNCFQIVILHRCFTRLCQEFDDVDGLWIAFKLLSYIGVSQVGCFSAYSFDSCELLSNCYLTSVFHKKVFLAPKPPLVVNCFQIVILHRCFTRLVLEDDFDYKLWIAFKLLSYIGVSQVFLLPQLFLKSCELLSNCYLTSVFHKMDWYKSHEYIVVNCFQIVILHRCFTSFVLNVFLPLMLWIAFKLLSYIGVSQAPFIIIIFNSGCELLSNCYLTSVFHKCSAKSK